MKIDRSKTFFRYLKRVSLSLGTLAIIGMMPLSVGAQYIAEPDAYEPASPDFEVSVPQAPDVPKEFEAHKEPSSDEHVAMLYWTLAQKSPNIHKLAADNLNVGASPEEGKEEAKRLTDLLSTIEPKEDYIVVQDILDFRPSQGPSGEKYFNMAQLANDFSIAYKYHDLPLLLLPNDIENFSRVSISDDGLATFMKSFDSVPSINYTMQVRVDSVSPNKMPKTEKDEYFFMIGEIAYFALLSNMGEIIWEYKTPWHGEKASSALGGLYFQDSMVPQ